jgi:hypothetical protein
MQEFATYLNLKRVWYHLLSNQRTLELPARFRVIFDAELTLGQLQAVASRCLNHVSLLIV